MNVFQKEGSREETPDAGALLQNEQTKEEKIVRTFHAVAFACTGTLSVVLLAASAATICNAQTADSSVVVRIVTDEADAVLSILAKEKANQDITRPDWERVFSSDGYVRLKKRELSMRRTFNDDDFKGFVTSDSLVGRSEVLRATLEGWKIADISAASRRALAYLPDGARIKAKIYPVIKPKSNSFVFETSTDPAIFLFLDPAKSREDVENTLAHELHHIGYASSCAALATRLSEDSTISTQARKVLEWIGAFGEGFAMLAAAGGPNTHPHAVSEPAERKRWDSDMKNFNVDLKNIESFFLDILDGKLTSDGIEKTGYSFFGIQGPWYTVGWKMAVTIEKEYGRTRLIECICDPRLLLSTYNKAAVEHARSGGDPPGLWSASLIRQIAE